MGLGGHDFANFFRAFAEMVTGFIGENILQIRVDGLKLSKFQTQKEPE